MIAQKNLPYHLRSARLRWAALAITLEPDELSAMQEIATDSDRSERVRTNASLLVALHNRVPIPDICDRLDLDRRTLFRVASDLIKARSRRRVAV